jgi:hypothetical protein
MRRDMANVLPVFYLGMSELDMWSDRIIHGDHISPGSLFGVDRVAQVACLSNRAAQLRFLNNSQGELSQIDLHGLLDSGKVKVAF